ncbi:SPOR domain-containing protein [Noviherbaspirillum sp.]|uniref:SPOR domain-containing protein n=1 Tax=Noviherbaspirillum sp. TaxID=1926288 RepID=UPI002FDF0C91
MLKFFFWILLLANAVLLAYQQGYLDELVASGREPGRLQNQLNADKIRVAPVPPQASAPQASAPSVETAAMTAAVDQPAPAPSSPAQSTPAAEVVAQKADTPSCVEIGNFNAADAQRFESRLAALSLGDRVSRHGVQEVLRHMVYIPPQPDREAAERKTAELRQLGVTDFYVIQDNSDMRWAISLGVFKIEDVARAHLADLNRKGVRSARIGERTLTTKAVAFRFKGWDAAMKESVDKIRTDFPNLEMRECKVA